MSRIGKLPIDIPEGVNVKIADDSIIVTGPKGELSQSLPSEVTVAQNDKVINVDRTGDTKRHRAHHGLFRALINNMVVGVFAGFEKTLEIQGVGYTVEAKGKVLVFNLGFSHPIYFRIPDEIQVEIPTKTAIKLTSIHKQILGDVAARIRKLRPPEPYKGKGIRYHGEYVRRKVGKTAG